MVFLQVRNLSKTYRFRSGHLGLKSQVKHILKNVSLELMEGETFALVGESGSGKTTLGKCMVRLISPTEGEILYRGQNLLQLSEKAFRPYRKKFQMIFQNPPGALNPRQTVGSCLNEALQVGGKMNVGERQDRIHELLTMVRLPEDTVVKYPYELSGGQQQRVLIARALALDPQFLVADEPTSNLDAVLKLQSLTLFQELKERFGLTLLLIAHDLLLVRNIADRIGVMVQGKIVEIGPVRQIYHQPEHPYTRTLLHFAGLSINSAPTNLVAGRGNSNRLENHDCCTFTQRCSRRKEICHFVSPQMQEITAGHFVACHSLQKENCAGENNVIQSV